MPFNTPKFQGNDFSAERPHYVHSAITIEHWGTQIAIAENGNVTLTKVVKKHSSDSEIEYDEIEVTAGVIFKAAQFLKATRRIVTPDAEAKKENGETEKV